MLGPELVKFFPMPDLMNRLGSGIPDDFLPILVVGAHHYLAVGTDYDPLVELRAREVVFVYDVLVIPKIVDQWIEGDKVGDRLEGVVV